MSTLDTNEPPEFQLYNGSRQYANFCRLPELFPHRKMTASQTPVRFTGGPSVELPETYQFEGEARTTRDLIETTDTSALLVLKDGQVRFEEYYLTGGRDVQWISWSVAKSFISALIGIALAENKIASIEDAVSDYVPSLKGSGYEGVSLKHILQMSSGVRWSENYSDPNAEVHRLSSVMAGETSLEDFVAGMVAECPPGTLCQYNSADTQVLGLLLTYATGKSITDYMQEKLCEPLGMETDGYWLTDKVGMELTLGGLNLTARDFAKLGELFRCHGQFAGQQILPADWVKESVSLKAPHLHPGHVIVGGHTFPFGYGYQWWIPDEATEEYSAIGVYNQFVYVDPARNITIVKLSANPLYGTSPDEEINKEAETLAFLRQIGSSVE